MSDIPLRLQSWVSTIQTVVLTADVFQLKKTCLIYHADCKVEFQPFKRSYSQLTFFNLKNIQTVVLTADVFQLEKFWVEKRQLWVRPFEWLKLNFESCVVYQTRSYNMVFVELTHDMIINTQAVLVLGCIWPFVLHTRLNRAFRYVFRFVSDSIWDNFASFIPKLHFLSKSKKRLLRSWWFSDDISDKFRVVCIGPNPDPSKRP